MVVELVGALLSLAAHSGPLLASAPEPEQRVVRRSEGLGRVGGLLIVGRTKCRGAGGSVGPRSFKEESWYAEAAEEALHEETDVKSTQRLTTRRPTLAPLPQPTPTPTPQANPGRRLD